MRGVPPLDLPRLQWSPTSGLDPSTALCRGPYTPSRLPSPASRVPGVPVVPSFSSPSWDSTTPVIAGTFGSPSHRDWGFSSTPNWFRTHEPVGTSEVGRVRGGRSGEGPESPDVLSGDDGNRGSPRLSGRPSPDPWGSVTVHTRVGEWTLGGEVRGRFPGTTTPDGDRTPPRSDRDSGPRRKPETPGVKGDRTEEEKDRGTDTGWTTRPVSGVGCHGRSSRPRRLRVPYLDDRDTSRPTGAPVSSKTTGESGGTDASSRPPPWPLNRHWHTSASVPYTPHPDPRPGGLGVQS